MDLSQGLTTLSDIAGALLTILGGLKLIAHYTPFKWDDEALAAIEKPLKALASFIRKDK